MANRFMLDYQSAEALPGLGQALSRSVDSYQAGVDRTRRREREDELLRREREAIAQQEAMQGMRQDLMDELYGAPQGMMPEQPVDEMYGQEAPFFLQRPEEILNPETALAEREELRGAGVDTPEKEQDLLDFTQSIAGASDDEIPGIVNERLERGVAEGRDMTDTAELTRQSPQQVRQNVGVAQRLIQNEKFRQMYAQDPGAAQAFAKGLAMFDPAQVKDQEYKFVAVDGQLYRTNAKTGEATSVGGEGGLNKELRKEARSAIRQDLKKVKTAVNTITSNRSKLENLASEIKGGNRSAVAQGLVALVKLNDPNSAVLTAEMEAALNKENPVAAASKVLTDSGTSQGVVDAVMQQIDPLNPETIDVPGLLRTADAMIAANIPSIQGDYDSLVETADAAELTDAAKQSLFTKSLQDSMGNLSKFTYDPQAQPEVDMAAVVITHPALGNITEQDIQDTMAARGMTRDQVIQAMSAK